ncbi:MAG: autotransporter-associated beta strand repeat-containing protein, partial [Candidatus Omnitrophota bacterium]
MNPILKKASGLFYPKIHGAPPPMKKFLAVVAILSLVFSPVTPAFAVDGSWNADADGSWIVPADWAGGLIPGTGGTANFDRWLMAHVNRTVTVDDNRSIFGILFNNPEPAGYTLTGGNLLLEDDGWISTNAGNGAHTDTIDSAIEIQGVGGNAYFDAYGSAVSLLKIGGGVTGVSTGGNTTTLWLEGTSTGNNEISGIIGNGGAGGNLSVIKLECGTWTLSGNNTYTGGTIFQEGTLNINSNTALGGAAGTFTIGDVLGVTDYVKTLGNTSGGLITLDNGNAIDAKGDFTYTSVDDLDLGAGGMTLWGDGAVMVTVDGSVLSTTGTISDGGNNYGLEKEGAGTLQLGGVNTFTGGVSLIMGTLNLCAVDALGWGTFTLGGSPGDLITFDVPLGGGTNTRNNNVVINNDFTFTGTNNFNVGTGTVALGAATRTVTVEANTLTIGGIISGAAGVGLVKAGAGTLQLTGVNTYTGETAVTGGTLQIGDGTTGSLNGTTGTALTFLGSGGTVNFNEAAGSSQSMGALIVDGGDATVQSTYGGSGTTTLTFASLGGSDGVTGNFIISGGTNATNKIVLTGFTAGFIDPAIFFGGSAYAWYDAASYVRGIVYGTDAGAVTNAGGGTLGSATHQQITGAIAGQNTATFTTLNISGNNNFELAGGQTVTVNGILKTGNTAGGATISGGTGIQAANDWDFVIRTDGANDALTISTPILVNGTNGLTKSGAGTLILSGANTYTGETTVNAGELDLNSAGTAINGDLTISGGTVKLLQANQIADTASVAVSGGTFSIQGFNEAVTNVQLTGGTISGTTGILTTTNAFDMQSGAVSAILNDDAADNGLMKTTSGIVTLSGVNTYAGTTIVDGGSLKIAATTGSLNAASALTFGGTGTFTYDNTGSGGDRSQSLGALTFSAGDGTVQTILRAPYNVTLTFSSLAARVAGATGNFDVYGGIIGSGGTSNNKIVLTGAGAGFINKGIFFGGSAYAWNDAGGYVRTIDYSNDTGATSSGTTDTLAGVAHQQITGDITAQATATFTTLNISGNSDFFLAENQIVTVDGILKTGNSEGAQISSFELGAGIQASAGAELVIRTDGAYDELTILIPINNNAGSSLTKTGAGTLILSGDNPYTGLTTVNAGELDLNSNWTGLSGDLTISGGTAKLLKADQIVNTSDVVVSGGTFNIQGFNETVANVQLTEGVISGTTGTLTGTTAFDMQDGTVSAILGGAVGLAKTTSGEVTLSGANTYSGITTISDGTLIATTSASALGTNATAPAITMYNATASTASILQLRNDTGLNFGRKVTIQSNNGYSEIDSGRLLVSGAGVTHTLGDLSLESVFLVVGIGDTLTTSGTQGLTFGNVTLTGDATIGIGTDLPTSVAGLLYLGDVNSGGNKFNLSVTGWNPSDAAIAISMGTMADLGGVGNGLTITDTYGLVTVRGAIGDGTAGEVTITDSSAGVIFGLTVDATTITITDTAAAQTISFTGNTNATTGMSAGAGTGAYNVSMTGGTNLIAGATVFANTGTVTLGNGGDTFTFTGGLDTTAASTNIGGTVATTDTAMDLGATTQTTNSTLKSGSGTIGVTTMTDGGSSFNLSLGSASQTGAITFSGNLTVNAIT